MGSIISLVERRAATRRGPLRLLLAFYRRFAGLFLELAKFGTVGAVAAVVDIGGSNLLRFGVGLGPLTSATISVTAATTVAFLGNRYWTWRQRERSSLAREYFLFFVLNGIGLLIALLCLGFTEYTLKLHDPLAYNLSKNVVGLGLGTAFRFWSYKKWVFLPPGDPAVDPRTGLPRAPHAGSGPAPAGDGEKPDVRQLRRAR